MLPILVSWSQNFTVSETNTYLSLRDALMIQQNSRKQAGASTIWKIRHLNKIKISKCIINKNYFLRKSHCFGIHRMVFKYDFDHKFLFTPYRKLKPQTLLLFVKEGIKAANILLLGLGQSSFTTSEKERTVDRENFLDKKRTKNNKYPNTNVVSHGKLEKGKRQMRGGEKRVDKLTGTSLQFSGNI